MLVELNLEPKQDWPRDSRMSVPWCCAVTAIAIDCSSEKACSCSAEVEAKIAAGPEAKNENGTS